MAATPDDFRLLRESVISMMKELDAMRPKSEIPAWEKKEMKFQRQLERRKKQLEKEKLASEKAKAKPKAAAKTKTSTVKPKVTKPKPTTPRSSGMRGGGAAILKKPMN